MTSLSLWHHYKISKILIVSMLYYCYANDANYYECNLLKWGNTDKLRWVKQSQVLWLLWTFKIIKRLNKKFGSRPVRSSHPMNPEIVLSNLSKWKKSAYLNDFIQEPHFLPKTGSQMPSSIFWEFLWESQSWS